MYMISIIIYSTVAVIGFIFSGLYLFKSKCMNYHIQALDKDWNKIPKEVRVLCLALMRVAGGGFLSMSITILCFLINNIQNTWEGSLMLLIIGEACLIPTLWATVYVKRNTKGNPPIMLCVIVIALLIVGFVSSLMF